MDIRKIILEEIKYSIFESMEHIQNLYKSWANKKSGNPEAAMKIMDDVISNRRSLPKKDFAKYNSYEELLKDLNQIKKAKAPDDVTKFYEDKDLLVMAANTWEASCKYGAGSKWCTTAKDTSSYWDRHNTTGTEFFWIFKNKPQDDPNHKFSYHIKVGGGTDWCNAVNNCRTNPQILIHLHPNYDEIIQKLQEFHDSRTLSVPSESIRHMNLSFIDEWLNNNYDEIINEIKNYLTSSGHISVLRKTEIESVVDEFYFHPNDDLENLYDLGVDELDFENLLYDYLENINLNQNDINYDDIGPDLSYFIIEILQNKFGFNTELPFDDEIADQFDGNLEVSVIFNDEIYEEYNYEFFEIIHETIGRDIGGLYYEKAEEFISNYLEEYKRKNNLD